MLPTWQFGLVETLTSFNVKKFQTKINIGNIDSRFRRNGDYKNQKGSFFFEIHSFYVKHEHFQPLIISSETFDSI